MADKPIGSLPKATAIYDDSAFVMEQDGRSMQTDAETLKEYFFGEGTNNWIVQGNLTSMTADKTATDVFAAVDASKGVKMYLHTSGSTDYIGADLLSVAYDSPSESFIALFVRRTEGTSGEWQDIVYALDNAGALTVYDRDTAVSTTRSTTVASNARLSLAYTPTDDLHAVNKKYVDDSVRVGTVSSINNMTGDVTLHIPSKLSELDNDEGYLKTSPGAALVPFTATEGVPATNVQDAIVNVQSQIAGAVTGSIPDNSLSLQKLVQSELQTLVEKYAVGDIYITTLDVEDPSTVLGYGQWIKLEGKFLLGSSEDHSVGSTGGSETHQLTVNELPSHNHRLGIENPGGQQTGGSKLKYAYNPTAIYYGGADMIESTGGSQAHNNMPPYFVVNMWLRVA